MQQLQRCSRESRSAALVPEKRTQRFPGLSTEVSAEKDRKASKKQLALEIFSHTERNFCFSR